MRWHTEPDEAAQLIRVSDLKPQLRQAEADLERTPSEGTPRDKFGIRFIRPLDPLRDSFGDAELCGTHEKTVRAINKWIELIKEGESPLSRLVFF